MGLSRSRPGRRPLPSGSEADNTDSSDEPESSTFVPQAIVPALATVAPTPQPTAPAARATPSVALESISDASVVQLRQALDAGEISVRELVEACVDRIDELDGGDYGLGAIIEINPELMEIAETRDRELRRGESRGPLHGIPIVVKDLFATGDSMATTAGSLALLNNPAVRDAFLITQLREAGAILLGKTNMTEWSNFKGTVQTSGWSPRGGQTRNPYRLDIIAVGLQLRLRRRGRRRPRAAGARCRDRWLDHLSRLGHGDRGDEADGGPDQSCRGDSDLVSPRIHPGRWRGRSPMSPHC